MILTGKDWMSLGRIRPSHPDVQATYYHVEAQMLVPAQKYSGESCMVRIIKPERLGHLIDEKGVLLEHGKFSFDSTEDVPK